jgi:predicted MFS family arabinose efflux permease
MSQFNLLGTTRFLPLFCTQFLGALNDNIYKNALVIFIAFTLADRTSINSSILVIIAGGVFILPFFLFSATAGQIADKYEKAMLIRRIKVAEIVIMSMAAVGFMLQDVSVLMAVLFFMGAQSTFFGPLKYGILPQHLDVDELTGGNGLIQTATYLAILAGTIIGGVLISLGATGTVLVSATVIAVAVAGWASSRSIPRAEPYDTGLALDWNIVRQTYRIMHYAMDNREMFTTIIANSWFWFLGATFLSLVPGYTRDILNGNELVATTLLFAFSVGIGSGSMFCEKLSRGRIEPGLVPLGGLGLTLFSLDLFLASPAGPAQFLTTMHPSQFLLEWRYLHVLLDFIFIGFCGGLYIVPLYAMIQYRSHPDHRARVIAANNILNALFMVVSAVIVTGLINASIGITRIFMLVAVFNIIMNAVVFLRSGEFLRTSRTLLKSWLKQDRVDDVSGM